MTLISASFPEPTELQTQEVAPHFHPWSVSFTSCVSDLASPLANGIEMWYHQESDPNSVW